MTEPQHVGVRMDSVERAVADIAAGKAVVVVDDENRENEGDLIFAASKATPDLMAFTIRYSSGVICVPMPGTMLDRLEIPLMTPHNKDRMRTAYTISVDARDGVTTGISATDRAHTVRVLADSATALAEYGLDGRHLRAFKLSADREVGLVEQAIAPYLRRGAANRDVPGDVTQLVISFHAALVRTAMERTI